MIMRCFALAMLVLLLSACAATVPTVPTELTQNEKAAQINIQLGIEYLRQNNLQQADAKLRRALGQAPNMALANWTFALLQERLGEYESAEIHFKRAIKLDPRDARANNNYGTFLCARNRLKDAEQQFLLAVANPLYRFPESAYSNAGVCALKASDSSKAEEYFRLALKKDPKYSPALFQMANLLYAQGNYLQTRAYLERYTEVAKQSPGILWLGYQVETSLGNKSAASQYALSLRTQFPESQETIKLQELQRNDL